MNEQEFYKKYGHDHTGAYAEAFLILNLLFIGIFYLELWILYLLNYKKASPISKSHLKQALLVSSISTLIVVALNIFILLTSSYASATALIVAEVYLMLIVPLFLIFGIRGFIKAVNEKKYNYPFIHKFIFVNHENV